MISFDFLYVHRINVAIFTQFFFMFSFTKHRFAFYAIALGLLIASLLSPLFLNLNLGIDMTGWIQVEYNLAKGNVDEILPSVKQEVVENAKKQLTADEQKIITDTLTYRISGTNNFVIEAGVSEEWITDLTKVEAAKSAFIKHLQNELSKINSDITQTRYVNIGASFGEYIKNSGYMTLALTILAISLYIQYAFRGSIDGMASWPFAVVTAVSLLHDVVIAFGLYVLTSAFFPEFKIDTFFLTAMLTVLGYSINDTIVVMDRIRSNLKDGTAKKISFSALIDKSIHDTLRRSLFTSLTIIIVLVAMFVFGPASLKGFTLALIFGGIVGTYSSICIASPLLIDITKRK
jgi:preprotein translocase subunit SecF